jgi:MFS family permease
MTKRLHLLSACLGNLFEHYDTALFSYLSPFLAPLIFPKEDPITALILTYAIIPLGMIARPLGSLVFGYIGDVYGRNQALFLTLAGMAFISGCIAFSPTYLQVGILAPILFCISRVLQNFFAAGEIMGGAIFLLENTDPKRHDLLSSLYSCSTMGGHLIASFGVFLLCTFHATDQGWRVLYLAGCITALFACLLRRSAPMTQPTEKFSKAANLWKYRRPLLYIAITSGFAYANYSIALVLMNGFLPLVTTFTKAEIMQVNTYLLIFDFCALPFFGWLASKMPRERLMLAASLGVVLCAIPLLMSLQGACLFGIIAVRAALVIFGVAFFAPYHAWAGQLIPPSCRYAVISLGYALGSQLIGSPTAALALWCFKQTSTISSTGWYWMALALASSIVLIKSRELAVAKIQ